MARVENLLQVVISNNAAILEIVQNEVHGISISSQTAEEWLTGLLNATQRAIHHFLASNGHQEINELHNLLIACNYTIRYISYKRLIIDFLDNFTSCYYTVLKYPIIADNVHCLKLRAIQGCTRIEESFGNERNSESHVVLKVISEFFETFKDITPDKVLFFYAVSEFLRVLIQTSPKQFAVAARQNLPNLFLFYKILIPTENSDKILRESLIKEHMELLSIFFEAILQPISDPLELLGVSTYLEIEEKNSSNPEIPLFNVNEILSHEDHLHTSNLLIEATFGAIDTLKERLVGIPHLLSLFCQVSLTNFPISSSQLIVKASLEALAESLKNILNLLVKDSTSSKNFLYSDLEFLLCIVESVSCILQTSYRQSISLELFSDIYDQFNKILPCLFKLVKNCELTKQTIVKRHSSLIREALFKFYLVSLHTNAQQMLSNISFFIQNTFRQLADPRLISDILYVLIKKEENTFNRDSLIEELLNILEKSVLSLDSYSKSAAIRIVESIGRVCFVLKEDIERHIERFNKWIFILLKAFDRKADSLGTAIIETVTISVLVSKEVILDQEWFSSFLDLMKNCIVGVFPDSLKKLKFRKGEDAIADLELPLTLNSLDLFQVMLERKISINKDLLLYFLDYISLQIIIPPIYDSDSYLRTKQIQFYGSLLNHLLSTNNSELKDIQSSITLLAKLEETSEDKQIQIPCRRLLANFSSSFS